MDVSNYDSLMTIWLHIAVAPHLSSSWHVSVITLTIERHLVSYRTTRDHQGEINDPATDH